MRRNFTSGFGSGDVTLLRVNIYQQSKFRRDHSIHVCNITISVWKNERPPYWNSTSGFNFDHITVTLAYYSASRRQMSSTSGHPSRCYDVRPDFQDGGRRYRANVLPVSDWVTKIFSECQSLSANQIWSEYLNPRLRYNYFRFKKQTFPILEFCFRF